MTTFSEPVKLSSSSSLSPNDAKTNKPKTNNNQSTTTTTEKESLTKSLSSSALRPFVIISSSYLLFTITDGALRMIVLLHAYNKSFTALEVSIMFMLYELAGVFTNLAAGFMGARWGIKLTLITGLTLQLVGIGLLFGWDDQWPKSTAIIYVTIAQMFAGIAKDLTKLGGKTVTKLVTPEGRQTRLFKLVSLITGWKNSLKGVGYFVGAALVDVSYELALGVLMGIVALAMPWVLLRLDRDLGTAKKTNASSWREVFVLDNYNLNILSFARLFLFASRDFWFEVPLPYYLRSPSCQGLGVDSCVFDSDCTRGAVCGLDDGICQNLSPGGGCGGLGLDRVVVGAFLGGYIILYGQIQSWTPQLITGPLDQTPPNKYTEVLWGVINSIPTLLIYIVISASPYFDTQNPNQPVMTIWLVIILITFAVIFAINSSIHSYLVVNYAESDKIAASVGFYYMSNACGRLLGTIGSGFLFTYVGEDYGGVVGQDGTKGLAACFLAGTVSSLLAALITVKINDNERGLNCGSCFTLVAAQGGDGDDDDDDDDDNDDDSSSKVKYTHMGFCPVRLYSIEVWNVKTGKLAAGELGYSAGSVYTSLTGFTAEDSAGSVQLATLGRYLSNGSFDMWDLGMGLEYKSRLGAKDMDRVQFVETIHKLRIKDPNVRLKCDERIGCKDIIISKSQADKKDLNDV